MVVDANEAWNFAYVLPSLNPNDNIQLVISNALQMGWSKSPAFFCAATKTARDLADKYIADNHEFKPQPSEDICMNIDWDKIPAALRNDDEVKIFYLVESYLDNFITMIQTTDKDRLLQITC